MFKQNKTLHDLNIGGNESIIHSKDVIDHLNNGHIRLVHFVSYTMIYDLIVPILFQKIKHKRQ